MTSQDIEQRLKDHQLWLETNGQKGRQALFVNADLGGFDFSGMDLTLVNFDYANLKNADFMGAEIHGCSFFRANVSKARNIYSWQTPTKNNRICYSVNHKHVVKHKLGCFWGETAEAIKRIKKEHGEDSLYEKAVLLYSEAAMNQ